MTKKKSGGKKSKADRFAVIDAETDPFKRGRIPEPFLWGFYDGETYEEFENTEDLIKRVEAFDGYIYAHNGGKFDFHFLLKYMTRNIQISLINGRLVECKIGDATLRDSYSLLPAPLSAYKKDEISYTIFEKHKRKIAANWKKISSYLRGDCIYLFDMVTQFINSYGMHLTQAGAAMKTWQDMNDDKPPASTKKFFEDFSRFYYGGRVEVFKSGNVKGPLKLYDINSAYPWAMLSEHPYRLNYLESTRATLDDIKDTTFLEVSCISKGALPYRDDKGRITFPNDETKRTYYAIGHEFNSAMALNLIRDYTLHRTYNFSGQKDFRVYVNRFYELRKIAKAKVKDIQEGRSIENVDYWKAQDLFAKLLMNSLYGKFGANPDNYGHYMFANDDYKIEDYEGYHDYAKLDDVPVIKKELEDPEKRFFNVATAASITSQVRALLLRTIHASSGPIYCDTDSLLCTEFHGETGAELGQWKHEYNISEAWIAGKKMYAMKKTKRDKDGLYKIASKGVKLTATEIKKMCEGETILFRPQAPTFSVKKSAKFTNRNVKMLDEIKALG